MPNKRQEKIEKRRLARLALKAKKEDAEAVDEELDTEELVESEDQEPEIKQKDMGSMTYPDTQQGSEMDMGMMSMPTSWEDLDAQAAAEDQAKELRELGWDVQDLVYGILCNPDLTPVDKGDKIKAVGEGFSERVQNVLTTGEEMPNEKSLDGLEIESILAHDNRESGVVNKAWDVLKAKLTAKRENALQDSQFAFVTTRNGLKVRKYPIHDKAHVRNALGRAAQQIAAGGQDGADAKAALPKIRAAAKRFGIEVSTQKDRNAILVEKDQSGEYRWVGWVSNNFQDFDGDIFGEIAHKEYVDWFWANKDLAPIFVNWHTPGTNRSAPVDCAIYEKGFLILSGPLTDNEAEHLMKASTLANLGMSHGTFVLARDPNDPRVVTKYRMYECSDLPVENAANPFTAVESVSKEASMDKQAYLAAFLGEEKAKEFLARTGIKQKELVEAGVESKESKVETPPVQPAPAVDLTAQVRDILQKELDVEGLNEWVLKAKESLEKVEVLESLVKELQVDQNKKLAAAISPEPALKALSWSRNRAAAKDNNLVQEGEALSKAAPAIPDGAWLSEATGTVPLEAVK